MQFDWTTFILEILNFLVLLWILQRLVYRPVLSMLDERQQRIQAEIDRARLLREQAEALHQQYESQLADWHRQQEASRRQLDEELAQQRSTALEELKQTLNDEKAKIHARDQAITRSREAALIREAASTAYSQAAAMLKRMASAQLTETIANLFLEDLSTLEATEHSALQKAAAMRIDASALQIVSAHPLQESFRNELSGALSTAADQDLTFTFTQDASLIAGVRAIIGECQLDANLGAELAFFRRQANHG